MSVSSKSSAPQKSEAEIQYITQQLVNGAIDSVEECDRKQVFINLCAIRNELAHLNTSRERLNKIKTLIKKINSEMPIPVVGNKNRRNYRQSVRANSVTNRSTSKRKSNNQKNKMSQEEFDEYSSYVDYYLNGNHVEQDIDQSIKNKLLYVIKIRKDAEIESANYWEVKRLDDLVDEIRVPPQSPNKQLIDRIESLNQRLEQTRNKYDIAEQEMLKSYEQLEIQRQEQKQAMLDANNEELEQLENKIPEDDAVEFNKFSATLRGLRKDEENYVRGRDYAAAAKIHERADELEGIERRRYFENIHKTYEAKVADLLAQHNKKASAFETKWESIYNYESHIWEKRLNPLKNTIDALERELQTAYSRLARNTSQ